MATEGLVARTMMELADSLVEDFDVVDLLTLLSDRCVQTLDVQAAGVMLVSPLGELRVVASSSPAMRLLELYEEQSEEGPSQDCYLSGKPVLNARLADGRWPRFAPKALAAGFGSADALPMRHHDVSIGALNLFRVDGGPWNPRDVAIAQGFADMATIAILQNRAMVEALHENGNLSAALNDRSVIEQAKGMVSERTGLSMEEAVSLLATHAARHHARVVDVARYVINGSLSPAALDPG